jgi:hypothetical protein
MNRFITPGLIKGIRGSIVRLGLDKDEVIMDASGGRTSSTSKLTFDEARNLMAFLNDPDPRAPMRMKILSMAHQMRWTKENKPSELDLDLVNLKLTKAGYLHKDLNDYTYDELPKLVYQVEQMRNHFISKR